MNYIRGFHWQVLKDQEVSINRGSTTTRPHDVIHCWGLEHETQRPCLLRIENYPVTCMVELPGYSSAEPCSKRWTHADAKLIFDNICWMLTGDEVHAPTNYTFYPGDQSPEGWNFINGHSAYKPYMMRLEFTHSAALSHAVNMLRKPKYFGSNLGQLQLTIHDTEQKINVGFDIRYLVTIGAEHTSWLQFPAHSSTSYEVPEGSKRLARPSVREWVVAWYDLKPVEAVLSRELKANPKIMMFDIETYNFDHSRMPDRYHPSCVINIITCSFQREGQPETRKRHLITTLTVDHEKLLERGLKEVTIHSVSSEKDILRTFGQLIIENDPDVCSGYNTFGYDYAYIWRRWMLCDDGAHFPNWGRLVFDDTNWQDAPNRNNTRFRTGFIQWTGRLHIDLLQMVLKDYGTTMRSFTLDAVSLRFLKRGKKPVKAKEMFQIHEADLEYRAHGHEWSEDNVQAHMKRLTNFEEYADEDCQLCQDLWRELTTWISLLETAAAVGTNIIRVPQGGQQERCMSLLYREAVKQKFVLNHREDSENYPVTGGLVTPPVQGLHDDAITIDMKSEYPSIIQAFNICFSTFILPKKQHLPFYQELVPESDDGKYVFEFTQEEAPQTICTDYGVKRKKVQKKKGQVLPTVGYNFAYVGKNVREGLLPTLVRNKVQERDAVRKLQKTYSEGSLQWTICEQRQLALKVVANSFYGFLSARLDPGQLNRMSGALRFVVGSMCITARGRQLISNANIYLAEHYNAKIIYNDTDSVFFIVPREHWVNDNPVDTGHQLANIVTSIMRKPLQMEFEKVTRIYLLDKKCYAYFLISDDKKSYVCHSIKDVKSKGVPLARKEACQWTLSLYSAILLGIMSKTPFNILLRILFNALHALFAGQVPLKDLAIIRTINKDNYSSPNNTMALLAQKMRLLGLPVVLGQKLECVVEINKDAKYMGEKLTLLSHFNPEKHQLDLMHYFEKECVSSIDKLLRAIPRNNTVLRYETKVKHTLLDTSKPCRFIFEAMRDGHSLTTIQHQFYKAFPQASFSIQEPELDDSIHMV